VNEPKVRERTWRGLLAGFRIDPGSGSIEPTHAGLEQAMLVLGPPRCGKTSCFVVGSILGAPGAVVSTSTKPDVLQVTGPYRARWGRVYVFDPTGTVPLPSYAQRLCWSPVSGCESFEFAVATAHHLASAARPGASLSEAAHWVERAEALLGPLFHAAAIGGKNLADVMRWVLGHELREPAEILSKHASDMAKVILAGVVRTEDRERSGILSTAAGLLGAYRSEAALRAACSPNFDPVGFAYSSDTIYICAPAQSQEQLAPLVVTLIEQIRSAVYARPFGACPVILALDEVAQIAPLPSLPAIAAEGGGQGLITLACLQDLSQARVRWGAAAEGFFSLFSAKMIFPGIGDRRTLELVSALSGDRLVTTMSYTRPQRTFLFSGTRSAPTATQSQVFRPNLTVDEVFRGAPGTALVLERARPLCYTYVRPWWEVPRWRELVLGQATARPPEAASAGPDG